VYLNEITFLVNMILKDYPKSELPREKMIEYGVSTLSDSELLAIIIGTGNKNQDVLSLSRSIRKKYNLKELNSVTLNKIKEFKGISNAKACKLIACFELSNRIIKSKTDKLSELNYAKDVANIIIAKASTWNKEKLVVFLLNSRNKLINKKVVSVGTLNSNLIHPREIFSYAIENSAASIIISHNHPSGNLEPSSEDIIVTKELIKAGDIIGIPLLDHIIIANYNYYSMKDEGII
jgi:DNA repair protein RadC